MFSFSSSSSLSRVVKLTDMQNIQIPQSILDLVWYGNIDIHKDKKVIVTVVFNQGSLKDVKWLFDNLSKTDVLEAVVKPLRGRWNEKSLNLWCKYFNVTPNDNQ